MNKIMLNWNFMRIVRLLIAVSIAVQGFTTKDWMLFALGMTFSIMPLFNVGCCAGTHCSIPDAHSSSKGVEDISFEEIK